MRRAAKILLLSAALFIAVVGAVLSTHFGQSALLRFASAMASSEQSRIRIGPMQGSLFGDGSIGDISISDRQGVWLKARNIAFSWRPSALLTGHLSAPHLRVENIAILRQPEADPEQPKSADSSSFVLPVKVAIADLDVSAIDLSQAVLGERARLRLNGRANLNSLSEASTAELELVRIDAHQATLRTNLVYQPAERSLELAIDGSEAEGGMISRLLELPDRPALSVQLHGHGQLDAWKADLSASAAGNTFLAGIVRLDAEGENSHHLSARLAGYIQKLVPHGIADLAGGKTQLDLTADVSGLDGGASRSVKNLHLEISNDALHVAATGGVDLDSGLVHGQIEGHAGRKDGTPIQLSGGEGASIALRRATFEVAAPDTHERREIKASAQITGLALEQISASKLTLAVRAVQPQPVGRKPQALDDIKATLIVAGIDQTTAGGAALGPEARAAFAGSYDGQRLTISAFEIDAQNANANASGTIEGNHAKGIARLRLADLAQYSQLAGKPLKGRAHAEIHGDGDLSENTGSVTLVATSDGVGMGNATVDGLLAPSTKYEAHVERTPNGNVTVRNASVSNPLFGAQLNGNRAPEATALSGEATLTALSSVRPALSGSAKLTFDVHGPHDNLDSRIALSGNAVTLNGKPLKEPELKFSGRGPISKHAGTLTFGTKIASEILAGHADIVLSDTGATTLDNLAIDLAGLRINGHLGFRDQSLPTGLIEIGAPELARLGRTTGFRMTGRIKGSVKLEDSVADLNLSGDGINVAGAGIDGLRLTGKVSNYVSAPLGTVDLKARRIAQGANVVRELSSTVRLNSGSTTFASNGQLDGANFALSGDMTSEGDTGQIEIKSATYAGKGDVPHIRLPTPAKITVSNGQVSSKGIQLQIGTGTLRADGVAAAEALDMRLNLKNIPASVAGVVLPELGLIGVINGSATIKGKASDPRVDAKIAASGVSVADMRAQELPAIDVSTDVSMADGRANLKMRATTRGGFDLTADAAVSTIAGGDITSSAQGSVPLAMANVFLADRAAHADGKAAVMAKVTGKISDPKIDGKITIRDGRASDPATGLQLSGIELDAAFTRDKFTVQRLNAISQKGGSLTLSGTASLPSGTAANLDASLKLSGFRFGNQDPVAGEIDGDIKIAGPLASPAARGQLLIKRMDITVPNQLPMSVQSLDIRHVNAPPQFKSDKTDQELGNDAHAPAMTVSLDLDVTANDRIFVRGRGVDAQLGGAVRIAGTADKPYTDGKFSMSRGRLSIIGRQLDFSRGNILFSGSPEPSLDMEATVDADGTTITAKVTGPASKPKFKFSSSPELPEDEIVSLLLFNKKLAKLSPSQLVQLANEIDKIGGLSSGPGTLDKMKSALGIDVLDVTTDEKGKTQATAGSYVSDDTYVGVRQGTDFGKTRIIIDHNLTKHLKARGEVGTAGDSKLGVGFEFDY